jgi:hypothetical protein
MFGKARIHLINCLFVLSYIKPCVTATERSLRVSNSNIMDTNSRLLSTGTLQFVGNNGAVGLLDNCQGDCDKDSECKSGLKCFQRTKNQAVPGCTGDKPEWSGFDFCYKPPVPTPVKPVPTPVKPVPTPVKPPTPGTLKLVGNDGGPGFPLNACEGDCDKDSDCKPGLKCKQRKAAESVPGCTGDKKEFTGTDFCYKP